MSWSSTLNPGDFRLNSGFINGVLQPSVFGVRDPIASGKKMLDPLLRIASVSVARIQLADCPGFKGIIHAFRPLTIP